MRRVRLVIADRRPIVLQGFVSLLEAQPDFEVVACCLDGASCLAAIRSLTPDVVLLEDGFTDITAADILAAVDDEGLSSRLVFFTATIACGDLARAMAAGACGAIPMNAKPEALVQSLRLERPGSDLARVGNGANGIASFGNNVMAVLTVNERTVMDLVAEGLSDSQIARVLGVSLEIVRIHIDHARQKLGISSRTELAALALSRRYGAMSILAAAILAALDDSPGHAATGSFTVMAANDPAEVVTIKLGGKETLGTPAKAGSKDRAGPTPGTSASIGKLLDPLGEIAASSFAQAAVNAPRLGSSSSSIFMAAAFAALIYELDSGAHAAPAFDFGDGLADIVTSTTASDADGPAGALRAFANFGGPAVYDGAPAFEFAQGDATATDGSWVFVGDAHAEDGGSDRGTTVPQGSGSVDVVAAAANEGPQADPMQAGRDDRSDEGRSQSDVRASDNGFDAAKEHETRGDDSNHGRSQKAPHEPHGDFTAAKEQAKHEAMGNGLNHGQSQKGLDESDNGHRAAKGNAEQEASAEDPNHGQSHGNLRTFDGSDAGKQHAQQPKSGDLDAGKAQDMPAAHASSANDAHSASKIGPAGKDGPSSDDASGAKPLPGTKLGDSFHFKNGADAPSSDMLELKQLDHGRAYGDGQDAAAQDGPVPVQDIAWIDMSDAHHDHSGHANLQASHDLLV